MLWFLLVIILVLLWAVVAFNGLVVLKNRVNEADSDIGVQLKRRHDLIPNLVNTVKGYATHERELFERVTQARANAISAGEGDMKKRAQAENMLTGALKSLFAVVENYPELKANQNFLALQEELAETENKIMSARRFYNTNVRDYNIRREMVPINIIANMFSFKKRDMFELEDMKEAATPQVSFDKPGQPVSLTPEKPEPSIPTASSDDSRGSQADTQSGDLRSKGSRSAPEALKRRRQDPEGQATSPIPESPTPEPSAPSIPPTSEKPEIPTPPSPPTSSPARDASQGDDDADKTSPTPPHQ